MIVAHRSPIRFVLVLSLAFLLLASTVTAEETPVKVGLLVPLSGDLGPSGQLLVRAASLAQNHINEQGGILRGRPFEVIVADDRTDPETGAGAAARLVDEEGVAGIISVSSSDVALQVSSRVTIPKGVVHLTLATSPRIADLEDNDLVFRTVAPDSVQGLALGRLAARVGYARVAALHVDNEYGRGLAGAFAAGFAAEGGVVTASAPFDPGQDAYGPILRELAATGAEALLLIAYPESGIAILRESIEGGYFEDFLFGDGLQSAAVVEALGGALNGAWGTAPSRIGFPATDFVEELFERAYGPVEQPVYLIETYEALFLLALAIEKAGTTDGTAVRDALRDLSAVDGEPVFPGEWAKAVQLIREGKPIRYYGAPFPLGFDASGDPELGAIGVWTVIKEKIRMIASERIVEESRVYVP